MLLSSTGCCIILDDAGMEPDTRFHYLFVKGQIVRMWMQANGRITVDNRIHICAVADVIPMTKARYATL